MGHKGDRLQIKCEGRFKELRDGLVEAIELMSDGDPDFSMVRRADLTDLYELVETDIPTRDIRDPYYGNKFDELRTDPTIFREPQPGLGLVPLIFRDVRVNPALVEAYIRRLVSDEDIVDKLHLFFGDQAGGFEGVERLDCELGVPLNKIQLPGESGRHVSLAGYRISAGFGIGQNSHGTVAYDAPFHIEVYKIDPTEEKHAERNPKNAVMAIGFWVNQEETIEGRVKPVRRMVVGQIQGMRGARLPDGSYLGVTGLGIAEKVARSIGFDEVLVYSAQRHPVLNMYPESKERMMGEFRGYFNNSASKLGWERITKPHPQLANDTVIGYRRVLNGNGPTAK